MAPRLTPTNPETKTTAKATSNDTREPWITRLKISRPKLSVPRTCSAPMPSGDFIMAVSSCLLGLCGANSGPKMPIMMNAMTINPPLNAFTWKRGKGFATAPGLFSVADSRVNDCIESIDDQINRYKRHRVRHHESGHQWIVASVERRDQQTAAARPGENRLDDDRAAEQRAEFEADDGDDRDQRVAGHMAPDHIILT